MNLYEGHSKVALRPKTTEQVSQARCTPAAPYCKILYHMQSWPSRIHIALFTEWRSNVINILLGFSERTHRMHH